MTRPVLSRLVAVLDALSAVAALALAARIIAKVGISVPAVALCAVLALFAAVCAVAAAGMWRATRVGALLTLLVQGLQLPQLETSPLTYLVHLSLAAVLGLGRDLHLHWSLAWRPRINITPDSGADSPWVGVNLIALVAVLVAAGTLRAKNPAKSGLP
jgi:hypothetical protein